jgi:NAD-dependent SIR2 family protein deacetylase
LSNNIQKEIFLTYPAERDVLFVLGAGTSHPDGVPLQRDILPQIMNGSVEEISESEIGKEVIEFVNENFDFDEKSNYPRLEAVFGFLDYFILQNESLSAKYSNEKLRKIKEYLIKLLHFIVDYRTEKKSKYYRLFWESISKFNPNISIVTLNYDTLLEQAFDFLFEKFGYIDYAINFMNYEKNEKLKPFNFWIDPRKPLTVKTDAHPVAIKILKLHGSLNWKYCNCCNQTLLTPWDRKIDLNKGKFLGYTYPDNIEYEYSCPIDGTDFQTLIMPPSYYKELTHNVILPLMAEAGKEIRAAKRIVVIGYSLSDADIHIKALFQKHISSSQELIVINRKNTPQIKLRYSSITKKVKFYEKTFQETVTDKNFMKKLLTV